MTNYSAGENYLKAILVLHQRLDKVRKTDIADFLGFTKASVSYMVKLLEANKLVRVENNNVCLTEMGLKEALNIYERYLRIRDFLVYFLGISAKTAERDACRLEHVLSLETFEALKEKEVSV
ncbi:metal-dependent transcriptional regulator [Eubacterium sp. 1001713B170207_170306_E7]|uniref:metal-dependent transcriptional regulator n=1 Tax=Eubacterium sp. 1001713B170207_170306_E7 TaxID=2787097 RepID=UPI001898D582|nr:metal-dependent transcriptional regulator [Eubacterium sp. 1001713B170207_170306_E7]